ncbi:ATP-dependent RNA helicase Ecym_2193 [Eremothecium cymbalariae DBVPG|uniref:ATP-dependent RNA helicase n=1 Tax=Eremothecium cymbalariae (strain CBS 270.75 / DBVPG 7215 / KCTC 17166 / NRRL Y-17582) TaxID=931890 RepID=G8JP37_ERECY|nr:Hypothetical protein Ecym_2193 [Eremothecium cymbalariae DBVPG\
MYILNSLRLQKRLPEAVRVQLWCFRRCKVASRVTELKRKTNLHSKPFQYGKHGGLTTGDEQLLYDSKKLVEKITDFDQLKVLPDVRTSLRAIIASETIVNNSLHEEEFDLSNGKLMESAANIKPTPIQVTVIQRLSKKLMDPRLQVHLVAAETGSGKTMSYIFPLVDYLKRQECETPESWLQIQNKAIIRAVILVPTHELVEQVYDTIKKLEPVLGLKAFSWDINTPYQMFLDALKGRIDVMVTTPGKILSLFRINMIHRPDRILSQVKFLVMDEADTLMDQSWVEDSYEVIKKMQNVNHLLFCSATIPVEFEKTIKKLFPTFNVFVSPNLHKINKKSEIKVINSSLNPYKGSKIKALAQTLYAILKDNSDKVYEKRCVVFVNEKQSVQSVVTTLREKYGHDVHGFSSTDTIEDRLIKIRAFTQPPMPFENQFKEKPVSNNIKKVLPNSNIVLDKFDQKDTNMKPENMNPLKVLVTTDLLARGINFRGVKHVVLYDIPAKSVDLIHRVGRTGRMKQKGTIYIIGDKKLKAWAKGLPSIVKKNVAIQ